MSSPSQLQDLFKIANNIATRLQERDFDSVLIVSHIDADGLTAASIASLALKREQIDHDVKFIKQLDDPVISELDEVLDSKKESKILFWFTDLGSGMYKSINKFKPIITDHHAPSIVDFDIPKESRTDLLEFSSVLEYQLDEHHLNPHLFNFDGTYEISGAGAVYLVARELNQNNKDLAYLAIIGAVGDLQDSRFRRLTGINRKILDDAEQTGKIITKQDLSSFGRETRPLYNILMYSTDPYFPGLTMNETNCVKFFKRLEIPLKISGRHRHWVDLTDDERQKILSELMELLLSKGIGHKDAKRLIGEVYTLPDEELGTSLHDAKEFATVLNSCGKYNRAEIGYQLCLGDRKDALKKAYQLLRGHKSILMEGMQYVKELGIIEYGELQYFDAGNKIPDNIIGTIAGMILGNNDADPEKPLFGIVLSEDGAGLKVSGRTTRALVKKGLNLSEVMRETSSALGCGSVGGGHDIAAGATIPLDKREEFLKLADELVKKQLGES